jgi:hypothetical protein
MDPDQTARTRRLVWINAGRKRTMLVLSWHGSIFVDVLFIFVPKPASGKRLQVLTKIGLLAATVYQCRASFSIRSEFKII